MNMLSAINALPKGIVIYCKSQKFIFFNTKLVDNQKFIIWFNHRFGVDLGAISNKGQRYEIAHNKMNFKYMYAIYKNVCI